MVIRVNKRLLLISVFFLCIIGFYCFPHKTAPVSATPSPSLSIIMYHHISSKEKLLGEYTITPQQFENDLAYLKKNGYQTLTMSDLIENVEQGTPLPEKPVVLTFDDGYESFFAYAFPLLKQYEVKAVLSIIGYHTDLYTEKQDHNLDYSHLNWDQVSELHQSGLVEIQNHTYNMHKISSKRKGCRITPSESCDQYTGTLQQDIGTFQQLIIEKLSYTPTTFAFPYGFTCQEAFPILKELGFKASLGCIQKPNPLPLTEETLLCLGRFNRPHGPSSEEFLRKVLE